MAYDVVCVARKCYNLLLNSVIKCYQNGLLRTVVDVLDFKN